MMLLGLPRAVLICTLLLALMWVAACQNNNQQAEEAKDSLSLQANEQAFKDAKDVLTEVPSPLELASLMKKAGVNFNEQLLNSPKNAPRYSTSYKQALNMGAYGADLSYAAYFNQSQLAENYLNTIARLGTDLQVVGAFEKDLMTRFEKNLSNQDSLLQLITEQFENADAHLKSTQRADVAALIIAGGWIEGLYLASEIDRNKPNNLVQERLLEQKIPLKSLLSLLERFKDKEGMQTLIAQLVKLQGLYDGVKITYTVKPATTTVDNNSGVKTLQMGTTSKAEATADTVKAIQAQAIALRNSIVS